MNVILLSRRDGRARQFNLARPVTLGVVLAATALIATLSGGVSAARATPRNVTQDQHGSVQATIIAPAAATLATTTLWAQAASQREAAGGEIFSFAGPRAI